MVVLDRRFRTTLDKTFIQQSPGIPVAACAGCCLRVTTGVAKLPHILGEELSFSQVRAIAAFLSAVSVKP